jgi:hypothetical protein
MTIDPRRILEDAAAQRSPCEVLPRGGGLLRASVLRVEKGGVVLLVGDHRFVGGEDLRVWLAGDARGWTFEASVVRVGVPVPDRSRDGVLIGFIDKFTEATPGREGGGRVLELLPPTGPPVSLLAPPARLVQLSVDGAAFVMPTDFRLIFVQSGSVRVRLGLPGGPRIEATARVRSLSAGDGYLLYELRFEQVDDPASHREVVDRLQSTVDDG